jgi:hypothetical protein
MIRLLFDFEETTIAQLCDLNLLTVIFVLMADGVAEEKQEAAALVRSMTDKDIEFEEFDILIQNGVIPAVL